MDGQVQEAFPARRHILPDILILAGDMIVKLITNLK